MPLNGTAGTATVTVVEIAPNDGTTFNAAVSGMVASGTVVAEIKAGAATDATGNASAASASVDKTVTIQQMLIYCMFCFQRTPFPLIILFCLLRQRRCKSSLMKM